MAVFRVFFPSSIWSAEYNTFKLLNAHTILSVVTVLLVEEKSYLTKGTFFCWMFVPEILPNNVRLLAKINVDLSDLSCLQIFSDLLLSYVFNQIWFVALVFVLVASTYIFSSFFHVKCQLSPYSVLVLCSARISCHVVKSAP